MSVNGRVLSVHLVHELMMKLEKAGFTAADAQRIIGSEGNQLAEKIVRLVTGQKLSWQQAREIMKGNFFGPEEWKKFFGLSDQLTTLPEFPWTEDQLTNPGLKQEHFLFLGLTSVGHDSLDLLYWYKRPKGVLERVSVHDTVKRVLANKFALQSCQRRWYLMPLDSVEGSMNLPFDQQVAMLPADYEVPSAIEFFTASMLCGLLNRGKHMSWSAWSRTRDVSDEGFRVDVYTRTDYNYCTPCIKCNEDDGARRHIGLAASRKS